MSKKYFTKYLPVKGEIKGNGTYWIALENLGKLPPLKLHFGISFTEAEAKEKQITKVKLFLCSRDIQQKGGDDLCKCDLEKDGLKNFRCKYNGDQQECFEVIGEISPEATWVREGDEFDEEDIKKPQDLGYPFIAARTYYRVKGQCGHFH